MSKKLAKQLEKMEAGKKKAEKQLEVTNRKMAALKSEERKIRNRRIYTLGGIVEEAGLRGVNPKQLSNIFRHIKFGLDGQEQDIDDGWHYELLVLLGKNICEPAPSTITPAPQAPTHNGLLEVRFQCPMPGNLTAELKKRGFSFDRAKTVWRGKGIEADIRQAIERAGQIQNLHAITLLSPAS